MQQNIIDKIWKTHVVESIEGFPDILSIDLQLLHEVTSPQAFTELEKHHIPVYAPHRQLATMDHSISTGENREKPTNTLAYKQIEKLRYNCKKQGISLFDMGSGYQGIVHVVSPELGFTQPGITMVCGDSHTSTHGALGALAFGVGTSEVFHVLATGCILQHKPKTFKVNFHGKLGDGITAKDLILHLIRCIGTSGGVGYFIEYTGPVMASLDIESRMTICNMSIECGARGGIISPDAITYDYLYTRPFAPKGALWNEALNYYRTLPSDKDALFDKSIDINIEQLHPQVTWGIDPSQTIGINESLPSLEQFSKEQRKHMEKAFSYVQLEPGSPIDGTPIDYVFIGSCTNSRITDLKKAASIFKNRKVAKNVVAFVVPGSEQVYKEALKLGLDRVFLDAGAQFRMPGCSMCIAMNNDTVPPGKRCASTSNRNFIGRQGPGSITHLMSPQMAAAAAITGKICDFRKLL